MSVFPGFFPRSFRITLYILPMKFHSLCQQPPNRWIAPSFCIPRLDLSLLQTSISNIFLDTYFHQHLLTKRFHLSFHHLFYVLYLVPMLPKSILNPQNVIGFFRYTKSKVIPSLNRRIKSRSFTYVQSEGRTRYKLSCTYNRCSINTCWQDKWKGCRVLKLLFLRFGELLCGKEGNSFS
jgi:hypothetical protein